MVQGGNPEMRPDQALRALSRAGSGPAPQNIIVIARQVIVFGPGGGLFVYNAARTILEESIAGAATTDPVLHQAVPAGTATYNSFGKVISLLSTANKAFFQYADAGATQGQLIASLSSSAGTDPVAGFAYNAGLYGLDPVGGNITTAGPVISFGEIPYTRSGQIKPVIGSVAVRPYLQLDAPEQTSATHLQMLMSGTSPNGANPAQLLLGVVSGSATLASATGSTIETQSSSATQSSVSGVQPSLPANSLGLDIRISGDGAARAALTAGFTGAGAGVSAGDGTHGHDVFLVRNAAGQWVTSTLLAVAPGTATTAETWHAVGAGLLAGWTNTGGGTDPAEYRLEPDNSVWLAGDISGGTITSPTTIFNLPAAYRPATNQQVIPLAILTGATAAQQLSPVVGVTTAGAVQIFNVPAGTTRIQFNGKFKLDA